MLIDAPVQEGQAPVAPSQQDLNFGTIEEAVDSMVDTDEQPEESSEAPKPDKAQAPEEAEEETVEESDEEESEEDEAGQEEETDEAEEETDEDVGLLEDGDTLPDDMLSEIFIKDANGEKVSITDLKNGGLRQSHFTQKMQAIAKESKNLQRVGDATRQFMESQLNMMQNLNEYYTQHENVFDDNGKQMLNQHKELFGIIRQATTNWQKDFDQALTDAKYMQAKESYPRLIGYVPEWSSAAYQQLQDYLNDEYDTPPQLLAEILDPGIMALMWRGMQRNKAAKNLNKKRHQVIKRKAKQAKQTKAAPARAAPKKNPALDKITDIDSAVDYFMGLKDG